MRKRKKTAIARFERFFSSLFLFFLRRHRVLFVDHSHLSGHLVVALSL
jgi:hypothetical protein